MVLQSKLKRVSYSGNYRWLPTIGRGFDSLHPHQIREVIMKLCSKCLEVLPFDSFFKCSKSKSGFQSQCKMCKVISVKSSPSQTKENKRLYDMSRKTPKHRELKELTIIKIRSRGIYLDVLDTLLMGNKNP